MPPGLGSGPGTRSRWDEIVTAAEAAPAFAAVIDVDAPDFAAPGDMPARIRAYCRRTGQPAPTEPGPLARVVFESLALKYRRTLEMLDELVGQPDGGAAHRRGRHAEPAPEPVRGERHRPAGGDGPHRGHGRGQHPDADAGDRRHRLAGRRPVRRPAVVRHRTIRPTRDGGVGRRVREVQPVGFVSATMTSPMTHNTPATASNPGMFTTADGKNPAVTFTLVSSLFLLWGFCNGMIDVMDKHFQEELHLTLAQSAWVQFAHYLGYFLMALPAGWLATQARLQGRHHRRAC